MLRLQNFAAMLTCQKQLFSLPKEVAYLNCAYMAPLPKPVEAEGQLAISKKALPFQIKIPDFFEPASHLKSLFARLVNVSDPERIAIISSASYGISSVARNVAISSHQKILVVDEIFPSNYYPWQRLAMDKGASLEIVHRPTHTHEIGKEWNERILSAIDNETAVVAIPNVHWADGTRFDLLGIRQRTNEVGALLVVDGTQSVGALPFDIAKIQPDALVCAGYKWLMGPYGLGLAYFGERFDNGVPLEENWINRLGSEQFEHLTNYQSAYKPGANRYCMGEHSQFIHLPMLAKALELLLEWGVDNIQQYCTNLIAPYLERLAIQGFRIEDEPYRANHLLGLRTSSSSQLERLKKETLQNNVYVSYRAGVMRIAPNVYNDSADLDRLLAVVEQKGQ